MIEVKDRIPTHPGRVKLVPVKGEENTYDMVRADSPIEAGTPLNKALFDSMQNYIYNAVQAIDNKVFEFSQFAEVDSLPDGATFGLRENGILTPYIKVKSNYEGTGRPLVFRRNVTHQEKLYTTGYADYGASPVDSWLNNEFLTRFESDVQSAITAVPIDVADEDKTLVQISRRAFILSLYEYGISMSYVTKLGDSAAMFTGTDKRVALLNGVPVPHHTRSVDTSLDTTCIITAAGASERLGNDVVAGVRPAFTLPANFQVVVATYTTSNTVAKAEVIS